MSDFVNSVLKALDQAGSTSNIFTQQVEAKPATPETPTPSTPEQVVSELTINTASGGKKEIHKVPVRTITGKVKMAYPGGGSSGGAADGGD
jgi:hypothetical protein